ncbi:NaCP60E [Symbiodinium sp. CCMP2592]|nr:NaCP60E [Symbiodinium sp. CCMP2592]
MALAVAADDLAADVAHLGGEVRRLNQDVRGLEGRQVLMDRRLVELGSLIQGLKEEHFVQTFATERGQRTVALGAKRALAAATQLEQEGEWSKCMQGLGLDMESRLNEELATMTRRMEEQQRYVEQLGARLEAAAGNRLAVFGLGAFQGTSEVAETRLETRLASLEQSHRKLALGTHRALRVALSVREKQDDLEQEEEFEKWFGKAEDLEMPEDYQQRLSEQDQRLHKVLSICDHLVERVHDAGASLQALSHQQQELRAIAGKGEPHTALAYGEELREKVDELEAHLYGLAAQVQSQVEHKGKVTTLNLMDQHQERQQSRTFESFAMALEGLDARLERGLGEHGQILDMLQGGQDEQQVALRHLAQRLPEVARRLEQLWEQCQVYFPRLQEQEVHFGFLRASFEAHKQQMLDLTDGLQDKCKQGQGTKKPWKEVRYLTRVVSGSQGIAHKALCQATGSVEVGPVGWYIV